MEVNDVTVRFTEIFDSIMEAGVFENKSDLAKQIGTYPHNINWYLRRERNIPMNQLLKFLELTGISPAWMMLGEGEPFARPQPDSTSLVAAEPVRTEVVVETVDNAGHPNIVLVDTPAQAGYLQHGQDREFLTQLPSFTLPGSVLRNGTFRAFRINGNSMSPRISNGDISIGQLLLDWQHQVVDGRIYILVLHDDIVCKRVINRLADRNKLRLKSDNYTYEDYEVDGADVRQVFEWKCNLTFDGSNPFFDLYEWNQKLENQIFDLKAAMQQAGLSK